MQPRKQEHTKTIFVIASLALSTVPAHAQNQPRFRSGVEVTSIDVTVVDDDGHPVSDLSPADFTVRVDDTPRRVVSSEWVPRRPVTPVRPGELPSPLASRAKAIPDAGRLVLIVIDQPNIRYGGPIGHRAALGAFLDRLNPADPVGVINLGAGASSSSITTDRDEAKRILSKSVGGVPYPPSFKTNGELTFDAILALMKALQEIDAPKTIVLVSQGLIFSSDAAPLMAALTRTAAAARTTIYALRLDERVQGITQKQPAAAAFPPADAPPADTGTARELPDLPFPAGPAGDRGPDGVEAGGELEAVAAAAGGAMFTVAMSANQALARIESELSGYYLLGVESSAADGDGRPHALRVDVNRRGVAVRAGRYLPGPAP